MSDYLGHSTVTVQIGCKDLQINKVLARDLFQQCIIEMGILNNKIRKCKLNKTELCNRRMKCSRASSSSVTAVTDRSTAARLKCKETHI